MNYEPGGCTVPVYLIPSCRQWDMLESHTEKRKSSNLLMLFFFFFSLKAKLSGMSRLRIVLPAFKNVQLILSQRMVYVFALKFWLMY